MILSQGSHCALVIISELAFNYETRGLSLEEISKENNIPLDILKPIAEQLWESGIVECRKGSDNEQWFFLRRESVSISIFDVIALFDGDIFNGRFMDNKGKLLPKSKLSHIINLERDQVMCYMRNRCRRISILRWGELAHKTNIIHF